MLLPTTYTAALLLTILSMICWGSWANTQKLAGKWRFELYYYDYAVGVLLCAVLAATIFGSMSSQELGVLDTLALTGKRKMLWAVGAGVVFNLANLLLVAAIAIAGMSVAFPIGIGLALVIGVIWNYALDPQGNPMLLFGGAALVVAAIVVDALAYRKHAAVINAQKAKAMASAPPSNVPSRGVRPRRSAPVSPALKGISISLVSGLLMGSFYPLVQIARAGEDGVQPYADALLFSIGVFASTAVFNFFFLMMPVQGEALSFADYFRGTKKQHLLGLAGGLIWCAGAIANFVASSAPRAVQVGPAISYAMGQGATMISAMWGLLLWKEFRGADGRVKQLLALMFVLFACGLAMISIAPLYAH